MQFKKIFILFIVIFSIYASGMYIYFSLGPLYNDYCPITDTNKAPFILDDFLDPDHKYQLINDASCLNETRVYEIVPVKTIDDIRNAIKKARDKKLRIAVAGVRHSMGGQAFFDDAIVLDMTHFNRIIKLDQINKILTVESGATWHQIQLYLHKKNYAIKAMQSTDIFTVGGSLSVNAHGMDHIIGTIISTVKSFTIMLANGSVQKVTPTQNKELFDAVIGGYGLFGVILEVELEVTDNVMYEREIIFLNYHDFPTFFERIVQEKKYELFYVHLSTSPITFFRDILVYGYKKVTYSGKFKPLGKISLVNMRRFLLNLSKRRKYAQIFKWVAEKYIDPFLDKLHGHSMLSRNHVMHDSVEYLDNILINETDILQEYFIPRTHFVEYIDGMKTLLQKYNIPVLNASIRVVHKESNMLTYAPENMFSIVLYLNQHVTVDALQAMKKLTHDLIDLTLSFGGTFFLPYQLYFTSQQLKKAYPMIDEFFALKKEYDPSLLFINHFYAKYSNDFIKPKSLLK